MCGIVGYAGNRPAVPLLIAGLEQLEYRGYDSAGIACVDQRGGLFIVREKGRIRDLRRLVGSKDPGACSGIGHTRWATHGEPSRANAHPHTDASGRIAMVHNGIIENHAEIRAELERKGIRFRSRTDTEAAAQLIGFYLGRFRFEEAFLRALGRLKGFFSFVVICRDIPGRLYFFRRSNPLCIGLGKDERFIASDVTPLLSHTRRVLYVKDDEYGWISAGEARLFSLGSGKPVRRRPERILWDAARAGKGGYPHFMLKEIHEQPAVLKTLVSKLVDRRGQIRFDTLAPAAAGKLARASRVQLVSCGTAFHAAMAGGLMIEELARIRSTAQVSSEFRYGDPLVGRGDLVILITQSGETADTLAALREARERGAMTLAVVNVVGSTIAREADAVIYTHAGPEIGVASTKAYTAQLATLACLALFLAGLHGTLDKKKIAKWTRELGRLPEVCRRVLRHGRMVERCARRLRKVSNFLYLGRRYQFPTALEGALKLKEITYAHAHGYAAGEMKHGPIALIDEKQPVICLAPEGRTYEKMRANIEEIRARRGRIIAVGTEGDASLAGAAEFFFPVGRVPELLAPIPAVLPLQLLAYRIAVANGRDVDQPRNLAKSVTVE